MLTALDWERFLDVLSPYYSPDHGRPAESPVLMLKLEYLRYQYNLSDREVIARAETDLAFRYFLQIPMRFRLPDPSLLCMFRGRLGRDGFRAIFDAVVRAAREAGFVKDRLRIKDATHVIGNMTVPTSLALVAQIREKLLEAAKPFAPEMVEGELANLELLRETSATLKPEERLVTRVALLREILVWCDKLQRPPHAEINRLWQAFLTQKELAHKILEDNENPGRGDRTLSTTDPDARRGKHGEFFCGYLTDILLDPDSQIVTQINVFAASGDEAVDALELIGLEEAAQGNDIQALSIDGVGYNGPVLRALEDEDQLNVDTYVPVRARPDNGGIFDPDQFIEDADQTQATCPAGKTSVYRFHDAQKEAVTYRFSAEDCQREHRRAREKIGTPAYQAVKAEHPKVERKLGEMMNRHGGRKARYRTLPKVLIQELMVGVATNVKRLTRLLCAPTPEPC